MTFHWSNPLKNTLKSMDNEREGNHYLKPLDAIIFTQDRM